ncbi:sulfite exporter TauE/SafE family protein [soil metagenome]
MSPELIALVVAAGVATGVLSALFGVGGGIVMVPFIVIVLSRSQHVAEGTSLLVIVPTAVVGVLSHVRNGYVSFRHAGLVAAGGTAGALAGAEIALRIDADALTKVFALYLLVMGLRTAHQGAVAMRATRTKEVAR